MAETSYLWDNPGTGDSPGGGYGNAHFCQVINRMLFNGDGDQGVLNDFENELEVTDGGVDTATVDTGGSFQYGVWHWNDAALNVNINAFRGGNCLIIVRASWAAQTSRIVARAVGALTQNPGVTYEIPLANVAINGAGAITLITDTRDFCEYSTEIWPFGVTTDILAIDSATTAKMLDRDRWFLRSAGALAPDVTNPVVWTAITQHPRRNDWVFVDAALSSVWEVIRVPEDISGANISIRVWASPVTPAVTGDVRWLYNIWQAAAGGIAANTAGNIVQTLPVVDSGSTWTEDQLVSLAVTAGDLLLVEVARDGGHAADTLASSACMHAIYHYYTADS
jgi:hypothetical protein